MSDQTTAWLRCTIGSCQRHQMCMYAPCRAVKATPQTPLDPGLARRILDEAAVEVATWPEWKREMMREPFAPPPPLCPECGNKRCPHASDHRI